jgi:hypothetical protein
MYCVCNKTSFLGLASGKLLGDARILPDLVKYFACHMTMHVIGYVCKCRIPSDHIPIRSWPLFLARELMRDLIETLKAEQST